MAWTVVVEVVGWQTYSEGTANGFVGPGGRRERK